MEQPERRLKRALEDCDLSIIYDSRDAEKNEKSIHLEDNTLMGGSRADEDGGQERGENRPSVSRTDESSSNGIEQNGTSLLYEYKSYTKI